MFNFIFIIFSNFSSIVIFFIQILGKPQEQHWAVMNHDQDQQSTSYSTNP